MNIGSFLRCSSKIHLTKPKPDLAKLMSESDFISKESVH